LEKSKPPSTRPITGMMMSLTSESTIFAKAAPMITPTARSTTFPFDANSLNSVANPIVFSPLSRGGSASDADPGGKYSSPRVQVKCAGRPPSLA